METGELATNPPSHRLRHIPPLWFYALSISSFGIYLLAWIYRTARDSGAAGSDRRAPAWWAAGALCFPVCVAILYELTRHAARIRGRPPGASVWVPPLLHASIVAFATLSPWRSLMAPLLLAPVPFLIAQRALERAEVARTGSVLAPAPRTLRHWLLLAIGGTAAAAAIGWLDAAAIRELTRPRLEAGRVVVGRAHPYALEVPSDGWVAVEAGVVGDADSDLELVSANGDAWVVTYVHGGADIDDIIDSRRELLGQSLGRVSVEERRTFLPDSDFLPVSHAVYRGSIAGLGEVVYVVATVAGDHGVLEVIGFAPGSSEETDLTRFVTSVSWSKEGS